MCDFVLEYFAYLAFVSHHTAVFWFSLKKHQTNSYSIPLQRETLSYVVIAIARKNISSQYFPLCDIDAWRIPQKYFTFPFRLFFLLHQKHMKRFHSTVVVSRCLPGLMPLLRSIFKDFFTPSFTSETKPMQHELWTEWKTKSTRVSETCRRLLFLTCT